MAEACLHGEPTVSSRSKPGHCGYAKVVKARSAVVIVAAAAAARAGALQQTRICGLVWQTRDFPIPPTPAKDETCGKSWCPSRRKPAASRGLREVALLRAPRSVVARITDRELNAT